MPPPTYAVKTDAEIEKQVIASVFQASSSLQLISQYDGFSSEEEEQEEVEKKIESQGSGPAETYRSPSMQQIKKQSSGDSSNDSSSDSDDQVTANMAHKKFVEHIKDRIVNDSIDSESDEDDEEKSGQKKRDPLKVKGELFIEDLPHIEELKITVPENECLEIGIIVSIVEQLVLVEAYPNTAALDIDSVLFLEAGQKPLGAIFDVIGQVSQPLYCVRFNSVDEIKTRMIDVNQKVYSAPRTEYAQFVVLPTLMKQKGSDASWRNDLEPPNDQKDHSDDEEERLLKRNKKINKNRGSGNDAVQKHLNHNAQMNNSRGGRGGYRGQGRQQWNNNRPSDYHWHNNNMFQQPPPMINYQINGYQGNSFPSLPFPEMWTIHDQNQQKG